MPFRLSRKGPIPAYCSPPSIPVSHWPASTSHTTPSGVRHCSRAPEGLAIERTGSPVGTSRDRRGVHGSRRRVRRSAPQPKPARRRRGRWPCRPSGCLSAVESETAFLMAVAGRQASTPPSFCALARTSSTCALRCKAALERGRGHRRARGKAAVVGQRSGAPAAKAGRLPPERSCLARRRRWRRPGPAPLTEVESATHDYLVLTSQAKHVCHGSGQLGKM